MGYCERPTDSPLLACTWEQTTDAQLAQRVVPDACVDLIWSGERLVVAGPDTGPRVVPLAAGSRPVGARLAPGAAGAVLGMPASELCDISPDAADVLGRDATAALLERLHVALEPASQLVQALVCDRTLAPDPLVRAAVAALGRPGARVAPVASELGVSARQLQRRVSDAVGLGPKLLARILRFRRLQSLAPGPLAELALDAGYADQAHMTAEVTRLAGIPPVRFLKDRAA
ncbi:MAG: DUF6597 domain-containing transcriptional factor [Solirubrobacteraceae bacterium]